MQCEKSAPAAWCSCTAWLTVVYTERGSRIRIISARSADRTRTSTENPNTVRPVIGTVSFAERLEAVEAVTELRQQTQTLTDRLLESDAQRASVHASLERADTQIADWRDSVTLAREEQEKVARENARLNERLRSASDRR